VVAYGLRARPSRAARAAARLSGLGYALPGTVVAVAVYVPLAWLERRGGDALEAIAGADPGLLLTGTMAGLVLAYAVRFHGVALSAVEARMGGIDASLDEAARSLGADRSRLLAEVHLPLLWPGIATGALLVFVEVMKELPATALLRPLGGDTLAIAVWEATKDSRFDTAALPALLIVAAGLVPVVTAARLAHGRAG
jgi:iron(III) transport system permease protein